MGTNSLDDVGVALARWLAPFVAHELRLQSGRAPQAPPPPQASRAPVPQRREWRGRTSSAALPTQHEMVPLVLAALDALGGEAHRRDIVDKALELGEFSDEQMAVAPPPSQVGRYETKIHYHLAWALHLAKREGRLAKLGGARWRLLP